MKIRNNKGMAATVTAAALTDSDTIAFLSIVGAQTAVKAIWASVVGRQAHLMIGQRGHKSYVGDSEMEYVTIKLSPASGVHHWVIYPDPQPDDLFVLLLPLNDGRSKGQLLVELLNQHTLWPARPEWAEELWKRGRDLREANVVDDFPKKDVPRLVHKLKVYGSLEWAYAVSTVGWDDVIDRAVKDGTLPFAN